MLAERFPQASAALVDAEVDLLAFTQFPKAHWRRVWSTNPLERVNKELKRRANVVGILPEDPDARDDVLAGCGGSGAWRAMRCSLHRPPHDA